MVLGSVTEEKIRILSPLPVFFLLNFGDEKYFPLVHPLTLYRVVTLA